VVGLRPETITREASGEFAHKKIFLIPAGGSGGEFAIVKLWLEPLPRGSGIQYLGGNSARSLPKECAEGLEEGVYEALKNAVLNGGMVVDIKIAVMDAKYHDLDSSRKTFRIAAQGAFESAMCQAEPIFAD
jgi:elongation factor G